MKAFDTCDPEGIRTPDPQIRNLLLYPTELRDQLTFKKKGSNSLLISRLLTAVFVGVAGFEPTTFCSQSRRDTGLRYTPK